MDQVLAFFNLTHDDVRMIPVGVVLFVIFWQIFARVFVKPYLKLIETREEATSGAQSEAQSKEAEAQAILAQYEDRLTTARVHAMKRRLDELESVKQETVALIAKAESDAAEETKRGRADIQKKLDSIRASVMGDADSMADMIVQRLKAPRKEQGV